MTMKLGRKFSLDSSLSLNGVGGLSVRRNNKFSNKKSHQVLDEDQLRLQELGHSDVRTQTITEESFEQSSDSVSNQCFLKHNKNLHKLFPEIPTGENLTHIFTCALQKEVLYHGKLFLSKNHVCFYSSVLLKDTKVVIRASSIKEVRKHNSALSSLSIQTADGEKHSFMSFRNRDKCYRLLQSMRSHVQETSLNSSPPASSVENDMDHDQVSSQSSFEETVERPRLTRSNSINSNSSFPPFQSSSEDPTRDSSTRQSSLIDEDLPNEHRHDTWIGRLTEKVTPFFFYREMRNLSTLFYIYMVLIVLLLFTSGYVGLKITALEEQLNSLGALAELSHHHKE
ncbi:GRAM domain-containing protein 2B isoform X3 [Echeneis naucrates]|uniref:GRAM domain-containing protein 2B isoform X3 n=1 Tax=Echeneis naucrates TaxID=173247 RepID=UPI001113FA89|nr:GRAM domain-containing protein 2B-like isoform X3 [Echeneis naucrates]